MGSDFFRQKKKVFSPVLLVYFIVISLIVIRIFFIPENISITRRFIIRESTSHTIPTISTAFNLYTQEIVKPLSADNTRLDIFSNYLHGNVVFAQEYNLHNTRYLEKAVGTAVYTDGTVYLYSNTSDQKFRLDASPVTALWTDEKMVVVTENIYKQSSNKIHLFVYDTKKDLWKHKSMNISFVMGEYKNSYVFGETIFFNAKSGVYVFNGKQIKIYQQNARIQKFAGTKDFFAVQLLHDNNEVKTINIDLYTKNWGKIIFMSYFFTAIIPQLISVDIKSGNESPYYWILFLYAGKIYEAHLV